MTSAALGQRQYCAVWENNHVLDKQVHARVPVTTPLQSCVGVFVGHIVPS
jgi:hypothetical protein